MSIISWLPWNVIGSIISFVSVVDLATRFLDCKCQIVLRWCIVTFVVNKSAALIYNWTCLKSLRFEIKRETEVFFKGSLLGETNVLNIPDIDPSKPQPVPVYSLKYTFWLPVFVRNKKDPCFIFDCDALIRCLDNLTTSTSAHEITTILRDS